MPIMDTFRGNWPEIELDLVSGFHSDPLHLLRDGRADLVIVAQAVHRRAIAYQPLFRFEILAVMPPEHRLHAKRILRAEDFSGETLITYPVPEDRIDVIRHVLKPADVRFKQHSELTVAILQLVASRRGIAALPNWGIKSYVDHDYVIARRIGARGLWSDLYAATTKDMAAEPYVSRFHRGRQDHVLRHAEWIGAARLTASAKIVTTRLRSRFLFCFSCCRSRRIWRARLHISAASDAEGFSLACRFANLLPFRVFPACSLP